MGYLFLLLAAWFWGTSFVAGKYALEIASPALVVLQRFVLASLVWSVVIYQKRVAINMAIVKKLILVSILMIPMTFLLQFIGLQYTSASSAATMIGLEPLVVVFVGAIFFKVKPRILDSLWAAIALVGIYLMAGGLQGVQLLGCILVLISTTVVGLWVYLSKALMKSIDPTLFSALTTVIGTVFLVPTALIFSPTLVINWNLSGGLSILYLGIGCSLLAGWFWNKGLNLSHTNTSGLFLALEPVFGVVLAMLLLHDALTIWQIVGIVLIVVPVAVSSLVSVPNSGNFQ